MTESLPIKSLSELEHQEQGSCFVLLAGKEKSKTRDGKPFYRATFRDQTRSAVAMIWSDSPWFDPCESQWQPGEFFKTDCQFSDTQYGPQINLKSIRPVNDADAEEGFQPQDFYLSSRFNPEAMFTELLQIVEETIDPGPLNDLVTGLLTENAEMIQKIPAARRNHHAYNGGFIEHVLSVTKTARYLAEKFSEYYRGMHPPLSQELVIAGAILHDIGKLIELDYQPQGATYSSKGQLVGHILLGRDIVRDYAQKLTDFPPETLLRLEHIIVSHQNLPEWGSPIAPHTPEALLVHYADDIDAKFHMMATALEADPESDEPFTPRDNPMRRAIFRGNLD